jgi:Protein of unknown function (DUF2919)
MPRIDLQHYSINDFDDNMSLRPGPRLMMVILFLSKNLALPIIAFALEKTSGNPAVHFIKTDYSALLFLGSSIPAASVLLSSLNRNPNANRWHRSIWKIGKWLLLFSTLLEINLLIWTTYRLDGNLTVISQLAADIAIFFYLLFDKRVRDVFNDFPNPLKHNTICEPRT